MLASGESSGLGSAGGEGGSVGGRGQDGGGEDGGGDVHVVVLPLSVP